MRNYKPNKLRRNSSINSSKATNAENDSLSQNAFSPKATSQNKLHATRADCTIDSPGDDHVGYALLDLDNSYEVSEFTARPHFDSDQRRIRTNSEICAQLVTPCGNVWVANQLQKHNRIAIGIYMSWALAVLHTAQSVSRETGTPIESLTQYDFEEFFAKCPNDKQIVGYILGIESGLPQGQKPDERPSHVLIERFSSEMFKRGRSSDTVYITFYPVNQFFDWLCRVFVEFAEFDSSTVPVWQIRSEHVKGYRRYLQRRTEVGEIKDSTAQQYLRRIRTFFNLCYRSGLISQHPMHHIKDIESTSSAITLPTTEEVDRFFNVVLEYSDQPLLDFVAFLGLQLLGLRSIELARLRWENIHLSDRLMTCWRKGGKYHSMPLPSAFVECLYLLGPEKQGGVFTNNPASFAQDLYLRFRAYELLSHWHRGTGVHIFRHLFVTSLTYGDYDVRTVMTLTGHVNSYIMQRYIHRSPKELKQAVNKMYVKDVAKND